MRARILAIIPSFNEEKALPGLLSELGSEAPGCDLLVVDDGSTDGTSEAARGLAKFVKLPVNLGIGGAVQTGIMYAVAHGYDFCVQVDGDGQHEPGEIAKLVSEQIRSGADLVVGSRFLDESSFRSTRFRRVGIAFLQLAIRALYGKQVSDPTSGFRLMGRRAMALFRDTYPQDFPEPISIGLALKQGLSVSEIGVRMRPREHGTSSIGGLKSISYLLRVVGYLTIIRMER